jgi:hypothetical protein
MRNRMRNPQPGDRFLVPLWRSWDEVEITRIFWDIHHTWEFVEYVSKAEGERLVRLKTLKRRIAKGKVIEGTHETTDR